MNEFNKLIKDYVKTEVDSINTLLPAKIKRYYPSEMRADIVLLNKVEVNGNISEQSCIYSCPVMLPKVAGFFIGMPYKEGDVVMVAFSQVALDDLLNSGEAEETKQNRRFSLDDGVVLGGVQIESKGTLANASDEDIVMENIDTGTIIKVKANGDIEINGSKNITVSNEESINITTKDCKVEAGNDVYIKGKNIDVEGTNITLKGTVKLDKFNKAEGFCSTPNCLFTGAPHTTGEFKG